MAYTKSARKKCQFLANFEFDILRVLLKGFTSIREKIRSCWKLNSRKFSEKC